MLLFSFSVKERCCGKHKYLDVSMDQSSGVGFKGSILTFLRGHPRGVPLREFGDLYQQQSGQKLDFSQHGYCSLQQLLTEMKEHVVLDQMGEQPWVRIRRLSVPRLRGRRHPRSCEDSSAAEPERLKSSESGPRPWSSCHSLARTGSAHPLQLRAKMTPYEDGSRWESRLPVAASRLTQRGTPSDKFRPSASRLPRLLIRHPIPQSFREVNMTGDKATPLLTSDSREGCTRGVKNWFQKCLTEAQLLPALSREPTSCVTNGESSEFSLSTARGLGTATNPTAAHMPASSILEAQHDASSLKLLCQEDTPNALLPSCPAGLNSHSGLPVTCQFLERRLAEEMVSIATTTSEDMLPAGLLPPKDSSLPAPGPLFEMTIASENLAPNQFSSNVALSLPASNGQEWVSPNLAKSEIVQSEISLLPTALVCPVQTCSSVQDFCSMEGLMQGPPSEQLALDLTNPTSPILSIKDLSEMRENFLLRQDAASDYLPKPQIMPNQDPVPNTLTFPKAAESAISRTPDLPENKASLSPKQQVYGQLDRKAVGPHNSPTRSPSTEEKMLEILRKEAALGNNSLAKSLEGSVEEQQILPAASPVRLKHDLCIIL